ncbi:TPA: hypothetical protein ACQJO1_004661 [Vibrio parahaemolyticus]
MALNNIHYLFEAWTCQKLDISMRFHHEDIERRKARGLNVKKQNELRKKGARLKSCSGKADKLRAKLNRVTPRGKTWLKVAELSGL